MLEMVPAQNKIRIFARTSLDQKQQLVWRLARWK